MIPYFPARRLAALSIVFWVRVRSRRTARRADSGF